MSNEQIMIRRCEKADYLRAVEIFAEGFSGKFGKVVSDPGRLNQLIDDLGLISTSEQSNDYVAVDTSGEVLGVILLKEASQGPHDQNLSGRMLIERYGFLPMMRASLLGILIEHRPAEDELYIDSVAVSPQARGRGLGTLLLEFAAQTAVNRGCRVLSLQVMSQNTRAKQLYERNGFEVVSTRSSRVLRYLTGFREACKMHKQLMN